MGKAQGAYRWKKAGDWSPWWTNRGRRRRARPESRCPRRGSTTCCTVWWRTSIALAALLGPGSLSPAGSGTGPFGPRSWRRCWRGRCWDSYQKKKKKKVAGFEAYWGLRGDQSWWILFVLFLMSSHTLLTFQCEIEEFLRRTRKKLYERCVWCATCSFGGQMAASPSSLQISASWRLFGSIQVWNLWD